MYLDMFFKFGWQALYDTAIEVLRYYQSDILQLFDPSDIMALIKQVRYCDTTASEFHLSIINNAQNSQIKYD